MMCVPRSSRTLGETDMNDIIGDRTRSSRVLGVLGMHRSGTSALTGLLGKVGVALGSSMRAPHPGVNAKGYWEHLGVVYAHDRLLHDLGSSWDDPLPLPDGWWTRPDVTPHRRELANIIARDFDDLPLWGIKDPRMCRLVPLWRSLLAEFGIRPTWVLTCRHPAEVARSLARRDGFSAEKSGLLWLIHQLEAEWDTRGASRIFLEFEDVLAEPIVSLQRIGAEMARPFPIPIQSRLDEIWSFITPKLRHHREETDDLSVFGGWADLVEETQRVWADVVDRGESEDTLHRFETVRIELLRRQRDFDRSLTGHIALLYRRIAESQRQIEDIRRAPSWYLTKPLRLVERTVHRVVRRIPRPASRNGEESRNARRNTTNMIAADRKKTRASSVS